MKFLTYKSVICRYKSQVTPILSSFHRQKRIQSFSSVTSTLYCNQSINYSPSLSYLHSLSPYYLAHLPIRSFAFSPKSKQKKPTLNSILKRFYLLVHPDFFQSYQGHQKVNESNLQYLLNFLTQIKATKSDEPWPAAAHKTLTFYIKKRHNDIINPSLILNTSTTSNKRNSPTSKQPFKPPSSVGSIIEGQFHCVSITLSINGGNCKSTVERTLGHLFAICGLPREFTWDKEYWQDRLPKPFEQEDQEEDSGEVEEEDSSSHKRKENVRYST